MLGWISETETAFTFLTLGLAVIFLLRIMSSKVRSRRTKDLGELCDSLVSYRNALELVKQHPEIPHGMKAQLVLFAQTLLNRSDALRAHPVPANFEHTRKRDQDARAAAIWSHDVEDLRRVSETAATTVLDAIDAAIFAFFLCWKDLPEVAEPTYQILSNRQEKYLFLARIGRIRQAQRRDNNNAPYEHPVAKLRTA